jgi:hypothetical protein
MDEKLTEHASIRIRRNRWNKPGPGAVLGYIMRNWGAPEPKLKRLRKDRDFVDKINRGVAYIERGDHLIFCVEGSWDDLHKTKHGRFLSEYEEIMFDRKGGKRIRYSWANAILKGEGYKIDVDVR